MATDSDNVDGHLVDPRNIPGATQRDVLFSRLPEDKGQLLHESLFPDDAYEGETYWADLPTGAKTKWVNKQMGSETKREFLIVWRVSNDHSAVKLRQREHLGAQDVVDRHHTDRETSKRLFECLNFIFCAFVSVEDFMLERSFSKYDKLICYCRCLKKILSCQLGNTLGTSLSLVWWVSSNSTSSVELTIKRAS